MRHPVYPTRQEIYDLAWLSSKSLDLDWRSWPDRTRSRQVHQAVSLWLADQELTKWVDKVLEECHDLRDWHPDKWRPEPRCPYPVQRREVWRRGDSGMTVTHVIHVLTPWSQFVHLPGSWHNGRLVLGVMRRMGYRPSPTNRRWAPGEWVDLHVYCPVSDLTRAVIRAAQRRRSP